VLSAGLADVVHVVPAWQSPHKDSTSAPAADRLAMVELAFAGMPGLVIETREITAGHTCFTVDTLAGLRSEHGTDTWLLLIGADHLPGLSTWRQAGRLPELATVTVFARRGEVVSRSAVLAAGLDPGRTLIIADFDLPVSSSVIRAMLAAASPVAAGPVAGGLPESVARYIFAHRLYPAQEW
jgi:nicotinate-nucleotide adenylyltransferase